MEEKYVWPDHARVPLNHAPGCQVRDVVHGDLRNDPAPLIVTGYAALKKIVDLIAQRHPHPTGKRTHLLLGHEPFPDNRPPRATPRRLPLKSMEHWTAQGVSVRRCHKVILCLEALAREEVEIKHWPASRGGTLHAKAYLTTAAVTHGSSNFTDAGMTTNIEINARYSSGTERKRYGELRLVLLNYWNMAEDFSKEFAAILRELLQLVSWEEALARACAEALESEWVRPYMRPDGITHQPALWPAQRQGIAQALHIIDQQESVLIADATGSGKTRLGIHLIRTLLNQRIAAGRHGQGLVVIVCPAHLQNMWREEAARAELNLEVISSGALSRHGKKPTVESTTRMDCLQRAQIICVDEAHSFYNPKSKRTRNLLGNIADHTILFTATPINKSASDLRHVANMLGADNLDPDVHAALARITRRRMADTEDYRDTLKTIKTAIQQCTVRRTKAMFNLLIDREPGEYLGVNNKPCRFPRHNPKLYPMREPPGDRALAKGISELAAQLKAVNALRSPITRRPGLGPQASVSQAMRSAKALARYAVRSLLRSSTPALVEHIAGTQRASLDFPLPDIKVSKGGNLLEALSRGAGNLPRQKLPAEYLPDWLTCEAAHRRATDDDIALYTQILELAGQLTNSRELEKAKLLLAQLADHTLILAFDKSVITLHYLRALIKRRDAEARVLVATGENKRGRDEVLNTFKGGSGAGPAVALCSDSLSEGVNLQESSCAVHLDMPTVIRASEQRAGRVDRMDSDHEAIDVWYPRDAPEFAPTRAEKFIERHEQANRLMGTNAPLPEDMVVRDETPLTPEEHIAELEAHQTKDEWSDICDAFYPLYNLIGEGGLVARSVYDQYRTLPVQLTARVSIVETHANWAFFCLRGSATSIPQWLLFKSESPRPTTNLTEIANFLREQLSDDSTRDAQKMDGADNRYLELALDRLNRAQYHLLSRLKRIALDQLEKHISKCATMSEPNPGDHHMAHYDPEANPHGLDLEEVARWWLNQVRPFRYQRMLDTGLRETIRLHDLDEELLARRDELHPQLVSFFSDPPTSDPLELRISVCILGIGKHQPPVC